MFSLDPSGRRVNRPARFALLLVWPVLTILSRDLPGSGDPALEDPAGGVSLFAAPSEPPAGADADEDSGAPEGREPPCLPFHTIEGQGGQFSVMTGYIVNAAPPGEILGLPSFGYIHVDLNHGKHLESFTFTEALWDRVELGYAYDTFDVGDTYEDFNTLLQGFGAGPGTVGGHSIRMHVLNARIQIFKEGEFDLPWMPALTAGAHYKRNEDIEDVGEAIDTVVPGFMKDAVGIVDDDGWDFTLAASKMLTFLPHPVILTGVARSTEAAHIGFLGFTNDRTIVGEFAVCTLLTDKIAVGAEYRMKPSKYDTPPGTEGLLDQEDDWWTLEAGYLIDTHLSVSVGYGHFGQLLNHSANRGFGLAVKYEF